MEEYSCEFCKSIFKNKYTLKSHINGNKTCLKNRGLELKSNYICNGCNTICFTKHKLVVHQETCKDFLICMHKNEMERKDSTIQTLQDTISEIKEKNENKMKEIVDGHKKQIDELKSEYKEQIDKLQNILQTITTEAVTRPTTTINNNIRNNLSLTYTLDEIKQTDLNDLFSESLTEQVFMSGYKGLAKLCTDKIINTRDSKKLICCTDMSRKKFKYMDKKGNMNEDVEARAFVDKVKQPIKEAGKQVYNTMISNINDERDQVREEDYGKKDRLITKSFQVMERYKDIINIDDPKYNNEFTAELAILNKN